MCADEQGLIWGSESSANGAIRHRAGDRQCRLGAGVASAWVVIRKAMCQLDYPGESRHLTSMKLLINGKGGVHHIWVRYDDKINDAQRDGIRRALQADDLKHAMNDIPYGDRDTAMVTN